VLVAIIGVLDDVTSFELSLTVLYLVPTAVASWYGRRRLGLLVCILAAATMLLVDLRSGHEYSNVAIPVWNAAFRLGIFAVTADLLCRLRDSLEEVAALARTDGLTGVLNGGTFMQRCDAITKLADRYSHATALGYLDLDHFKLVNDTLGHDVGDRVLKAVAAEIVTRLRTSDVVARMGGDEFAILLPETGLAGATVAFTAIYDDLVALATRNQWPVDFSIGVVVFHSAPPTADEALRRADELMYTVKNAGKGRVVVEEFPRRLPSAPMLQP
jgi:diguanylate cyclase (GGDEF)-like protein